MPRRITLILGLAGCVVACGTPPPGPGAMAENFINAVAEGDYVGACAMLDAGARRSLNAVMRSPAGCPALLARCLPPRATVLRKDQVQLFYANVEPTIAGSHAVVRTSGTAVANRVKVLRLSRLGEHWQLISYGAERCPAGR